MSDKIRVLVVGCGNMGTSHARAYHQLDGFELVGVVSRGPESRGRLSAELGGVAQFASIEEGIAATQPDAVSINTYPDTHAEYARLALDAGAHIFMEKPIANTVEEAQKIVDMAVAAGRKVVIGYILRVHPAWKEFIHQARQLGKPLVMRMNLNQQSCGRMWDTHKSLMNSMSPIVDCGVHYVDVMCQMTQSTPVEVSAVGARLTDELVEGMYNYGMLIVRFADGSVGWYEAGWGPMMSETAFFVKDVVGPNGCVTIVKSQDEDGDGDSADVDSHTKTNCIRIHHGKLNEDKSDFIKPDEFINTEDEPDHDGLCLLEQEYFLRAIQEDVDLTDHLNDAVNSLRIVLAADEAVRNGGSVKL
jgi:predicted dehydrogenase